MTLSSWSRDLSGGRSMLDFHANKGPRTCSGLSRRDFLKAGSLGASALSLSLAELNLAEADRYAILRSVYHKAAPIHETGHQMMQTGHLFRGGREHPHYGSVLSQLKGPRPGGLPPFVVMPAPIGNTGVSVSHGQGAGYLGAKHEPFFLRGDPASPKFEVGDFSSGGGLDPNRLKDRKQLLDAIDDAHKAFDAT